MTTPTMMLDCDGFANALADYLEGDASDAVRAAVDAHAGTCSSCAALLADLNAIRTDATALPQLVPSRDLWAGIAERIDAPVIPMGTVGQPRVVRRTWLRSALAAAALVAVTAGVTHYLTRASLTAVAPIAQVDSKPAPTPLTPNAESTSIASEQPSARPAKARLASRVADTGEPVLDSEISKLRHIVNERRTQLDPKTIAVLEQSIAVIDSAIVQSRAALLKDPASGFLATQLNRSLEKKVELLRTATQLPFGT
jgi:hypothetical protein